MAYWLLKSEPGAWSWDDQVRCGPQGTEWDGVRNHQANNNMKAMKLGDRAFFYHSVDQKRIVGTVEVVKEWYLDPADPAGRFGMVDVAAREAFVSPVSLGRIKADDRLADMVLVKNSRLSVQPVEPKQWKLICKLGGVKG